eukprot:9015951-Ditylum_brightwellii.AAC.1
MFYVIFGATHQSTFGSGNRTFSLCALSRKPTLTKPIPRTRKIRGFNGHKEKVHMDISQWHRHRHHHQLQSVAVDLFPLVHPSMVIMSVLSLTSILTLFTWAANGS